MENNSLDTIKRSSEFLTVKKLGQRNWPTKWLLFNYMQNQEGHLRFGITASRKTGIAVVRNKLKRWVRDYIRGLPSSDQSLAFDINFIFKPMEDGFYKGLDHGEFKKAMDRGFANLRKVR